MAEDGNDGSLIGKPFYRRRPAKPATVSASLWRYTLIAAAPTSARSKPKA